jgi:hypothetical protein
VHLGQDAEQAPGDRFDVRVGQAAPADEEVVERMRAGPVRRLPFRRRGDEEPVGVAAPLDRDRQVGRAALAEAAARFIEAGEGGFDVGRDRDRREQQRLVPLRSADAEHSGEVVGDEFVGEREAVDPEAVAGPFLEVPGLKRSQDVTADEGVEPDAVEEGEIAGQPADVAVALSEVALGREAEGLKLSEQFL